jgi:lysophospholipase L1-like esterase
MKTSAAAAALLLCAACGGSPTTPTPPPPVSEIVLTCPADQHVGSVSTPTAIVSYPAPTSTGGTPPITTTCTPASNSAFALGTTTVTCNATDGVRAATCSFKVTLVPPQPVLSIQKVVAFGDSITAGENGEGSLRLIDLNNSYPTQLLAMMQARYTTQSPQVHNCGIPGEKADEGASRIDRVLAFYNADVLLLLEGINNLTGNFGSDWPIVQNALAHDIAVARGRGMPGVFLSTLLPVFPGNCTGASTCRGAMIDAGEIVNMNGVIKNLAAQQSVPLVDNYNSFLGHPEYIDNDGLHPLPLGNQVLAKQFLAAIQGKFETQLPTAAGTFSVAPAAASADCPYDNLASLTVLRSTAR